MRLRVKILSATIAILALFLLPLSIQNFLFDRLDDSDLIFYPKKVDDSKNAYVALLPALEQIREEEEKEKELYGRSKLLRSARRVTRHSMIDQLIERHKALLAAFSEASKLDSFQVSPELDFYNLMASEYMDEIKFLCELEILNIHKLLHEHKMEQASLEILKLFKYGYFLRNSGNGLIFFKKGTQLKDRALNFIKNWLAESNFESAYYEKTLRFIEKYTDSNALINGLKVEYSLAAGTIRDLEARNFKGDKDYEKVFRRYGAHPRMAAYFYNENIALSRVAEYFRQEIKNLNKPYVSILHKDIYPCMGPFSRYLSLLRGDVIGKVLLQIEIPKLRYAVEEEFRLDAKYNLTRVLLALRAYYSDTNNLPDELDELMPDYIEKIPKDPYSNKNLKYSRSRKMIYSVGGDMEDDKGHLQKDWCMKLRFYREGIIDHKERVGFNPAQN